MEIVHKKESFWEINDYPYIRVIQISEEDLNVLSEKLSREDIIEWLMWNDRNGIYSDEESVKEFGKAIDREEGLEIMLRQVAENRIIVNLRVI